MGFVRNVRAAGGTFTGTLTVVIFSQWNATSVTLASSGAQMCVDLWSFSETLIDVS